jgi:hypothetical protein
VASSPDGHGVYVASRGFIDDTSAGPEVRIPGAVAAFADDPTSGALTQLPRSEGCISTRAGGEPDPRNDRRACASGTRLQGASGIAVSPDSEAVYVAAAESNAIAVLVRPLISISPRRATPGSARISVRCLVAAPGGRCTGRLSLRTLRSLRIGGGRARQVRLASRRLSIPAGGRRALTIAMPRPLRSQLSRLAMRRVTVQATATARSRGRHSRTVKARLTIRLR